MTIKRRTLVTTLQVTLDQYKTILKADSAKQLNIIRNVMDMLNARSVGSLGYRIDGHEYDAIDVLTGMGYRDADHNFAQQLLSGKFNEKQERVLIGALQTFAKSVEKSPSLAAGVASSYVFYVPKLSTGIAAVRARRYGITTPGKGKISFTKMQFFEIGVLPEDFVSQVPSIKKALSLISPALKAQPSLMKSKVRITSGGYAKKRILSSRRGTNFGQVWNNIVAYLNRFTGDSRAQWKFLFAELGVLGQKETDRYLSGQKLIIQLLNKALSKPAIAQKILPALQQAAGQWPFPGSFVRKDVLYLPFDILEKSEVQAKKVEFADGLRALLVSTKPLVAKEHQRLYNTIINEFKIALSGALDFEENRTRFWAAMEQLRQISTSQATKARELAVVTGMRPL